VETRTIQPGNIVVAIAGDVKPSARVDQGGIPTVQHVFGVIQHAFPVKKHISCSRVITLLEHQLKLMMLFTMSIPIKGLRWKRLKHFIYLHYCHTQVQVQQLRTKPTETGYQDPSVTN